MTFRPKLIATTLLLCGAAALSVNAASYYNITGVSNGGMGMYPPFFSTQDIYLTQDAVPCTDVSWSMKIGTTTYRASGAGAVATCLGSETVTPENLYSLVKTYWADNNFAGNFSLGTDIDLGEISTTEGECTANHKPLPYVEMKTFEGNNHKISNLCYVSSSMTEPVGFFSSAKGGNVQNVNMDGVRIIVTGGSNDGADYYPAGSVAGTLDTLTFSNVKVSNISIEAPFAGGVAGLISNSTVTKVTATTNISISNSQPITTGYAGSEWVALNSPYSVFLGGIAGVSTRSNGTDHFTLDDDKVSATVQDKANGHLSALGGAVGMVFSSLDRYRKVSVVDGGTVADPVKSRISGGSAMGGVFGYVSILYQNNSPVTSDTGIVKLENISFTGELGGASSSDHIAVGGLVGRDSLLAFSKLEIVNSSANISFADELTTAGNYRYYAGGLIGYGNNCLSSDRKTDFLVIENSKSSGTMELAASDKATSGLHVTTFMGGVAGAACLAMEPRAFKENSSSVNIVSRVKTTGDSVSIGGMIGSMNVAGKAGVVLNNIEYSGKIAVEDSLGEVYVGGVVGQFREAYGGKTIGFKDVYVNSADNVIEYNAVASAKPAGAKVKGTRIGGLCAYCKEAGVIEKVGIRGGISVEGESKYVGDSLFVGGIMARFENASAPLVVQKSYTVGDIAVNATAATAKVGYLMGFGVVSATSSYTFRSNYHYAEGENVDAFGYFSETDTYGAGIADSWMDNPNMTYNIRNGVENPYADNALKNGTELAANMKVRNFAGILNDELAGTAEDPNVWCFDAGINGGLPYVTAKNAEPVTNDRTYMVYFFDEDEVTLIDKFNVKHGEASARPEDPVKEGKTFKGWDREDLLDAVTSPLTVYALFKVDSFKVEFCTEDDCPFFGYYTPDNMVPYGGTVDEPDLDAYANLLKKEGYNFVGWNDSSYATGVKSDVKIYPKYERALFDVVFVNEEGVSDSVRSFLFEDPIENLGVATKEPTVEYSYEFLKWVQTDDSEIPETMPAKDIYVKAGFKAVKNEFDVAFVNYDGTSIETQSVKYGEDASFPEYSLESEDWRFVGWSDSSIVGIEESKTISAKVKVRVQFKMGQDSVFHTEWIGYGYDMTGVNDMILDRDTLNGYEFKFKRWDALMGVVTGPMVVTAVYDSVRYEQTEVPESSSSAPVSSSSSYFVAEDLIDSVTIDTAGNAIRLVLTTKNVDPALKTAAHVIVSGEKGYTLEDVISDSLTSKAGTFTWEKHPLPMGKLNVEVLVFNDSTSDMYRDSVKVASTIDVKPLNWRMVSLSEVKQDKGWNRDADFFWWDEQNPIGDFWQYKVFEGGDVKALRGYWFGSYEGSSLMLDEPAAATDSVIEWELDSLFSGWNMVANPYGWYLELDTATAAKEDIHFWRWDDEDSQYKPTDVIGPYESVWAQAKKNTTWTVSAAPTFKKYGKSEASASQKVAALRKNAARKATAANWSMVAVLKGESGKTDSWNVLGAGSREESMGKAPVGMGKFVRLSIMDGKKKLAKSVKPFADEYEWNLKLSASENSDGELSFEGADALNQLGLSLLVTVDGKTQEVDGSRSIKVALTKTAKEATVRVVPAAKNIASRVNGFKVYQSAKGLQVGFNAPESLAGSTASYALVDVKGKVVSAGNFRASAGSNALNLTTPKSGLYFVQLKLGSQMASAKVLVK